MLDTLFYIASARMARVGGRPSPPRLLTYNITNRCNAHCSMCDIHGWSSQASTELSPEEFRSFISDPLLGNLDVVRITGGEPFIRGDINEIYAAIKEKTRCRIVYVTTNGSFPDRAERLARAAGGGSPKLHIQVSLDAMDDTHDRLRGTPGMKDSAVETVRRLAGLKKEFDFYVGVNQTVMPETMGCVDAVGDFVRSLGVGHHLFLGAKFHEGKTLDSVDPTEKKMDFEPEGGMTREQMETFYRKHRELKKAARADANRKEFAGALLREISEEYLNEGGRNRSLNGRPYPRPACMAMFAHFRLSPEGNIFSCSALRQHSAGCVKETAFSDVWRGPEAGKIRSCVLACKGCWIECDINPSVFFSGDVLPWFAGRAIRDREFRRNYLLRAKF